jgi:phosphatidylserine/phosphatidylglycerophosphate/cardiolipin synthase-like enzyme
MKTVLRHRSKIAVLLMLGLGVTANAANNEFFYENSSGSPLVPLINSAKVTLAIEIYEMDDPLVQAAIEAAALRQVQVQIVKEDVPVGAACRVFDAPNAADSASCSAQKSLVGFVQSHGGTYVPFLSALCGTPGSHCYEHGKMVIADNQLALISTGNFNTTNLCTLKEHPNNCNRDYTVITRDPVAISTLNQIFQDDVNGNTFDVATVLQHSGNQKLTVSPLSLNPIVSYIDSARRTLQIQNQYLKDPNMNAAIIRAARRGVQVFVMVASACSFGKPKASEAAAFRAVYSAFDAAGIHTRIFTRKILIKGVSGYLHAKAILVDGATSWIGSVNGSTMSLSNNREYGIFLTDQTQVSKLNTFMSSDFANPNGESWQDSLVCRNDPPPTPQSGGGGDGDVTTN